MFLYLFRMMLVIASFPLTMFAQFVSGVDSRQEGQNIIITYELKTLEPAEIRVSVSSNGGQSFSAPLQKVSGDVGRGIQAGARQIEWKVLEEFPELVGDAIVFQVEATIDFEIMSPITGKRLRVASKDFDKPMMYDKAKQACADVGYGWRLPSIEELRVIYNELHKKGKADFRPLGYWSVSEYRAVSAWVFYFQHGNPNVSKKNSSLYVRAVKDY
jgi:hypothetical protein